MIWTKHSVVAKAFLLLSCAALPSALPTAEDSVLRLPLRRDTGEDHQASSKARDVPVPLKNTQVRYLIDLQVGSNNQPITFNVDTGSSDIWMFTSAACDQCAGGTYDPSSSTTRQDAPDLGTLSITYVDATSVTGYYVTDQVNIGTSTVSPVYLGVITQSSGFNGVYSIMGIGLNGSEAGIKEHPTFVESLYQANVINNRSYSIHLNQLPATEGSILFGGVNKTQFSGDLVPLPIIPPTGTNKLPRLQVSWNYLAIANAAGDTTTLMSQDVGTPALLDTGTTVTTLPTDQFNQVYSYLGGTDASADSNGFYHLSCTTPNSDDYLTFGFGSGPAVTIKVPVSELLLKGNSLPGQCRFGIQPSAGDSQIFGDTFLRSAYMYVDFDANNISLAQSVWS